MSVLILGSVIVLALDDPLGDPDSKRAQAISILNLIFTCLFIAEGLLKVASTLDRFSFNYSHE